MQNTNLLLITGACWLLSGCAGNSSQSPALPSPDATGGVPGVVVPAQRASGVAQLGAVVRSEGLEESAMALFRLRFDPGTLTAALVPEVARAGQETDDIYDLSVDNFLQGDSFKIVGVGTDNGDFLLRYQFTHPFPAPLDPAQPASASNRGDLGIAGRVVFLTDIRGPGEFDFFVGDGDVRLFPGLLRNADGYIQPRGLLSLSSYSADTFPYIALVHEGTEGNRQDPLPVDDVRGNFDAVEGWQRDDYGSNNNGFTGYGVLHQGQSVTQKIRLDGVTLDAYGALDVQVAILAKYTDPRGGSTPDEKRANRLPGATPNTDLFVYREPHGSLDVESLQLVKAAGALRVNDTATSVTLGFHVVDWDARAVETIAANLALETNASRVAVGASGIPGLSVCIPGLLGDSTTVVEWEPGTLRNDDSDVGGDAAQDSGRPGDALYFEKSLANAISSGQQRGTLWGVLRATDPENDLPPGSRVALDPNLQPLTGDFPRVESYQAFPVIVGNSAPSLSVAMAGDSVQSGTSAAIQASAFEDPDGDTLTVEIDWDDNGQFEDTRLLETGANPPLWTSPEPYRSTSNLDQTRSIPVRFTDGFLPAPVPVAPALTFTLGPNRPPEISGTPVLQIADLNAPALFQVRQGTTMVSDPEDDPIAFRITNSLTGDIVKSNTFPITATFAPLTTIGPVTFTVHAIDTFHAGANGTAFSPLEGTILQRGWAIPMPVEENGGGVHPSDLVATESGVYVSGYYSEKVNFGGGVTPFAAKNTGFLVAYGTDGSFQWQRLFPGTDTTALGLMEFTPGGNLLTDGRFTGSADFGGGEEDADGADVMLLEFRPADGEFQTQSRLTGTSDSDEHVEGLVVSDAGDVLVSGWFSGTADFGTGATFAEGVYDGFVLRRTSGGGHLWDQVFSGDGIGQAGRIALSSTGPIYGMASTLGTIDLGNGPITPSISQGGVLYKLSGGSGEVIWNELLDPADGSVYGGGIGVSTDGAFVVVGGALYGAVDFGGGSRSDEGIWIASWTKDKTYRWDRTYKELVDGVSGSVNDLILDSGGNSFVSGSYFGTVDFGGGFRTAFHQEDPLLLSLSADGVYRWDVVLPDAEDNPGSAVALAGDDDLYWVGWFGGTVDFDPGPGEYFLHNASERDGFLARYRAGTGLWD